MLANLRKQTQETNWDDGRIARFMDNSSAYQIDLDSNVRLHLFAEENDNDNLQTIANECNSILQWMQVKSGFTVNLWLLDWPRWIAKDEWPSRSSVNGGWTVKGSNTIFVYRKEEWQRVLIHETIHALGWDWSMPTQPLPCWGFTEKDTLYPHLFEAWTELYAEWLYCGFYNRSWENQRAWQEEQALQILARAHTLPNWKEDTNIFAYYVCKACLAPHIAFLWAFRNGQTEDEFSFVLCGLVKPKLRELENRATQIVQRDISMRMSLN